MTIAAVQQYVFCFCRKILVYYVRQYESATVWPVFMMTLHGSHVTERLDLKWRHISN